MSFFSKKSKQTELEKLIGEIRPVLHSVPPNAPPMIPVLSFPIPPPLPHHFSMGGTIVSGQGFPDYTISNSSTDVLTAERRTFLENVKVEDIHNEFFLAHETLLKEAEEIINAKENEEHLLYAKLHRLGFRSNQKAHKGWYVESEIKQQKNLHEKILYYKQKYPLHKFITEVKVREICEKYNILVGNTSDFIGEIPKKNLLEILNFKIGKEDVIMATISMGYQIATKLSQSDVEKSVIESTSLNEVNKNFILESFKENIVPFMPDFSVKGVPLNNFLFPQMKICAPLKDFNMVNKQVMGYKIVDIPVNDPIVLYPVDMGFLVVSAWGDEAKEVVNEINN